MIAEGEDCIEHRAARHRRELSGVSAGTGGQERTRRGPTRTTPIEVKDGQISVRSTWPAVTAAAEVRHWTNWTATRGITGSNQTTSTRSVRRGARMHACGGGHLMTRGACASSAFDGRVHRRPQGRLAAVLATLSSLVVDAHHVRDSSTATFAGMEPSLRTHRTRPQGFGNLTEPIRAGTTETQT